MCSGKRSWPRREKCTPFKAGVRRWHTPASQRRPALGHRTPGSKPERHLPPRKHGCGRQGRACRCCGVPRPTPACWGLGRPRGGLPGGSGGGRGPMARVQSSEELPRGGRPSAWVLHCAAGAGYAARNRNRVIQRAAAEPPGRGPVPARCRCRLVGADRAAGAGCALVGARASRAARLSSPGPYGPGGAATRSEAAAKPGTTGWLSRGGASPDGLRAPGARGRLLRVEQRRAGAARLLVGTAAARWRPGTGVARRSAAWPAPACAPAAAAAAACRRH